MRNQTSKATRNARFILVLTFLFALSACADKQIVVKIPIKCDIPKRDKPAKQSNITQYLKDILIYTELLESDLNFCRGEHNASEPKQSKGKE